VTIRRTGRRLRSGVRVSGSPTGIPHSDQWYVRRVRAGAGRSFQLCNEIRHQSASRQRILRFPKRKAQRKQLRQQRARCRAQPGPATCMGRQLRRSRGDSQGSTTAATSRSSTQRTNVFGNASSASAHRT
jgi:hypothetical protein